MGRLADQQAVLLRQAVARAHVSVLEKLKRENWSETPSNRHLRDGGLLRSRHHLGVCSNAN